MCHFWGLDESASLHEDGGGLWHEEHAIAYLTQMQGELGESRRLARARATGEADACDRCSGTLLVLVRRDHRVLQVLAGAETHPRSH